MPLRKRKPKQELRRFAANIYIKRGPRPWVRGLYNASRWVSISKGYLYLAYGTGRGYWIFRNGARANLSFDDAKRVMRVNTFRVRFTRPVDYAFAKRNLSYWAR